MSDDYNKLQRDYAALQVENERLRQLCDEAAEAMEGLKFTTALMQSDFELIERLKAVKESSHNE